MTQETWIVPINPKYLDIKEHLKRSREIAVKKTKIVNKGDIAYIYLSSPISQIKYKGTIVESICDSKTLINHPYTEALKIYGPASFFLIKIDKEVADGIYNYDELKKHGVGQFQNVARASQQIMNYFKETEEKGN